MGTVKPAQEWWDNLCPETQDRLAGDPGAPVPPDLRGEVVAANGPDAYPPYRPPLLMWRWWPASWGGTPWASGTEDDYLLRDTFVAHIDADNEALLADIASQAGLPPSPVMEELTMRAGRRGLNSERRHVAPGPRISATVNMNSTPRSA